MAANLKMRVSPYVATRMARTRDDFRVDTFRAGGKGGQNANKVEAGIRITDLRTGISAEGREERDQLQNKRRAFERLAEKVRAFYEAEEAKARGERVREERTIRTYKEGYVLDHRTKKHYPLDDTLNGRLEPVIADCAILGAEVPNA